MPDRFTPEQQEEILLEYFGASDSEGSPLCPDCGEDLEFKSAVAAYFGLQVEVSCPACDGAFSWSQPVPEKPWKDLHLHYFLERHRKGQAPRCPIDDCQVSCAEFEGKVLEFICPYCNRRGRVRLEEEGEQEQG